MTVAGSTAIRLSAYVARFGPLLRLAGEFTVAYLLTRLVAAISSLLFVRLMPVAEYGVYTLFLTAFTFICTASDMGATESLAYFRRRSVKRGRSWRPYFEAILRFRRVIFLLGFAFAAAYVLVTAQHIAVAPSTLVAGIALLGIGAWLAIHSSMLAYALKLEQRFRAVYVADAANEATKLIGVGLLWLAGMALAVAGIGVVAAGAAASLCLIAHFSRATPIPGPDAVPESARLQRVRRRALLGQILPTLPGSIHFNLQGVFISWLAAYYGSAANLAQVGALGRLGVLIALIAGFTNTVLIPRLVSVQGDAAFRARYLQLWAMQLLSGGALLLLVAIAPSALLLILGKPYAGLNQELLVAAATSVVATWGGFAYSINLVRGWAKYQPWAVPFIVVGQVILFFTLDLTTTLGVLEFGLGSFSVGLTYQIFLNALGFASVGRVGRRGTR